MIQAVDAGMITIHAFLLAYATTTMTIGKATVSAGAWMNWIPPDRPSSTAMTMVGDDNDDRWLIGCLEVQVVSLAKRKYKSFLR